MATASFDLLLKPSCGGCGSTTDLYGSNCKHMTLCLSCGKTMAENRAKCYDCGTPITTLIREYNVRASTSSDKNFSIGRFVTGLPPFSRKKSAENKWSLQKEGLQGRQLTDGLREKYKNKPWLLEDETGQHQYHGQLEGAQSATYYLLMMQGKEFVATPAGSWYNFNKVAQYKQLTLEEAEEKMNKRKNNATGYERWMMKAATNGPAAFGEVNKEVITTSKAEASRPKRGKADEDGNLSDKGEEDVEEEEERKSRLGLNKKGMDDDEDGGKEADFDLDDDDIEKEMVTNLCFSLHIGEALGESSHGHDETCGDIYFPLDEVCSLLDDARPAVVDALPPVVSCPEGESEPTSLKDFLQQNGLNPPSPLVLTLLSPLDESLLQRLADLPTRSETRILSGDDWEHEEIFTDDDEAVGNDPEEREDLAPEIPAPPEIKQDDEDEGEEEGGLSKSGKELKKLLGRTGGLNESEAEDDEDEDEDDVEDEVGPSPVLVPKQKDIPKEEPAETTPSKPVPSSSSKGTPSSKASKSKRKLSGDDVKTPAGGAAKKVKTDNESRPTSAKDEPVSSSKSAAPMKGSGSQSVASTQSGPVTEDEIRAVLVAMSPMTTQDLVAKFKPRLKSQEDKKAFADILKRISKIQKTNGASYVVLRDK